MSEKQEQPDADGGPGNGAAPNSVGKLASADTYNRFIDVVDIVGMFVFGMLSAAAFSTNHPSWGIWLTYGTIVCALILLAHKFYSYNPAFVLLVFLIVTLIAWYGFKLWADSIVASPVVASPPVIPQAEPKPALKWQPPELPAGCTTVHILAGSTISTILVDSLTNEPRNVISLVVTPTPTGTNAVNISAFVKENRLYVRVPLPRGATTNPVPILMNNDLDEKLPPNWDRNYNQTAFEIVDEDESPLLQVVYKRPDDILVCGVFQSPAGILAVFPKSMNFISPQLPAQYRKPIFKYPSNLFPGVLAQ